jgi:hypothetical protein
MGLIEAAIERARLAAEKAELEEDTEGDTEE